MILNLGNQNFASICVRYILLYYDSALLVCLRVEFVMTFDFLSCWNLKFLRYELSAMGFSSVAVQLTCFFFNCSAPCASYLLRKRALYNDMSRQVKLCTSVTCDVDRWLAFWYNCIVLLYVLGMSAVLVICPAAVGVEKVNALNFALPPRYFSS